MSSIPCENHTCSKMIDPVHSVYQSCGLCQQPKYCSEKCRIMDWPLHACDNVFQVSESLDKRGFATPYFYEDTMKQKDIELLEPHNPVFCSYSIMHHNDNRTVSSAIVPRRVNYNAESSSFLLDSEKLSKGTEPSEALKQGKEYAIRVTVRPYGPKKLRTEQSKGTFITGSIGKDMIFAGNRANPTANRVAQEQGSDMTKDSLVFWPRITKENNIMCPSTCDLDVDLFLMRPGEKAFDSVPNAYVHTGFNAQGKSIKEAGRLVQSNYAQKLASKNISVPQGKSLISRHYQDGAGHQLVMTFEPVKSNMYKLVDLEFHLPSSPAPAEEGGGKSSPFPTPIETSMYTCNIRNFDQVVGVCQAVDEVLADSQTQQLIETPFTPDELTKLNKAASVIREYAHQMQAQNGQYTQDRVPQHVDTAIGYALDTMYSHIGVNVNVAYWAEKILKPYADFEIDVFALIRKMNKARQRKGSKANESDSKGSKVKKFFTRGVGKLSMKKLNASLKNLREALNRFISRLEDMDAQGCPQELMNKYKYLLSLVNKSSRGIVPEDEFMKGRLQGLGVTNDTDDTDYQSE